MVEYIICREYYYYHTLIGKTVGGTDMRQEATLTEWKELYEVATRIKELEPWKDLWDMDLIALRFGDDEEPVFMSV